MPTRPRSGAVPSSKTMTAIPKRPRTRKEMRLPKKIKKIVLCRSVDTELWRYRTLPPELHGGKYDTSSWELCYLEEGAPRLNPELIFNIRRRSSSMLRIS